MSQVSPSLRRLSDGYAHFCPGCEDMHLLPDRWTFNGDVNSPTFSPSFKHSGIKTIVVDGKWTGEWERDAQGKPVPYVCHYILTNGILNFCNDCTHSLSGKSVPLALLPDYYKD